MRWSDKEKEIQWRAKTSAWEKNFLEENTIPVQPEPSFLSKLFRFLGRRQQK
jgi:hypothetical protein